MEAKSCIRGAVSSSVVWGNFCLNGLPVATNLCFVIFSGMSRYKGLFGQMFCEEFI